MENPNEHAAAAQDGISDSNVLEEDDQYYLKSIFVYFRVENRLFHVPTYRFMDESQEFFRMCKLPQTLDCDEEGSSRDNPIVLPSSITKIDFRNFLKALYPLNVDTQLRLEVEEWLSVLRLSTLWHFLGYRQMAISEIEDEANALSTSEKVRYGRAFKVSSWIREGYKEIIKRSATISKAEALDIGYEATFDLFRIRDVQKTRSTQFSFDSSRDARDEKWETDFESAFGQELEKIRKEEKSLTRSTASKGSQPLQPVLSSSEDDRWAKAQSSSFFQQYSQPHPAPTSTGWGTITAPTDKSEGKKKHRRKQ